MRRRKLKEQVFTQAATGPKAAERKTFVLVTHDIAAAMETCDTLWPLGRERDASGNPLPGARIQKSFDFMACGLAWRDGIPNDPA